MTWSKESVLIEGSPSAEDIHFRTKVPICKFPKNDVVATRDHWKHHSSCNWSTPLSRKLLQEKRRIWQTVSAIATEGRQCFIVKKDDIVFRHLKHYYSLTLSNFQSTCLYIFVLCRNLAKYLLKYVLISPFLCRKTFEAQTGSRARKRSFKLWEHIYNFPQQRNYHHP